MLHNHCHFLLILNNGVENDMKPLDGMTLINHLFMDFLASEYVCMDLQHTNMMHFIFSGQHTARKHNLIFLPKSNYSQILWQVGEHMHSILWFGLMFH